MYRESFLAGNADYPKLRSGKELKVEVGFSVTSDAKRASALENDLRQAAEDLGLGGQIRIEKGG